MMPKVTDKRKGTLRGTLPSSEPLSRETQLVNDVLKFCSEHPSWPYILSKPRAARKQLAIAIAKTIVHWPIGKRVVE